MKNSGCYNCTNRKLGCHGKCEKYRQYKSVLEEMKERRKKEQLMFAYTRRSKVYG